ncbi:3-(3-hydroxy-phenyl)propionate transporter MhpT [Paraburkholderia aspalathi]|uniref:MFS transporter, AAHS family, 3-hydroxyphenylpropionic acid transporter n=1 Tax=Paraburkholderia aspalathi TaxID=1324617 RepID=A0A1I7DBL6_9BURK|nr:3-(3-hydroxy-phenyl)propionate transporter MhpT [Paraburkholderia aspalathi]SFU09112.1 MFS transporter, AAHS family, 3-hydroxyphenylpropionic acid transporter [Paraburkholderia aspalathi]
MNLPSLIKNTLEKALKSINPAQSSSTLTIWLCLIVALLEGLDLQAPGIAGARMAREFGLDHAHLGLAFSFGSLGLLPASAIGGRLSDLFGRKRVLMGSVVLFGVFSLATTQVDGFNSLLVARLLTGLGLGAAMPNLIALSSEASRPNRRNLAVGVMYCGMPFGASLAALIGVLWPDSSGWRQLFYIGGFGPLLVLPLLGLFLKESNYFIAGQTTISSGKANKPGIFFALFRDGRAAATASLWVSYLGTVIILYFLLNWLPSMLLSRGLTASEASTVQMVYNFGGGIGSILITSMMDRIGRTPTVTIMYAGMVVALVLLGTTSGSMVLVCGGFVAGICLLGGQSALYSIASSVYPTEVRGTGVGAAVAIGRVGAIIGPLGAGQLLSAGHSETTLLFASIPLIAVSAVAALLVVARFQMESCEAIVQ